MWARTLRTGRPHIWQSPRRVAFRRHINRQYDGSHTTYFQQPPKPKSLARKAFFYIAYGTTCLAVGAGGVLLALRSGLDLDLDMAEEMEEKMGQLVVAGSFDEAARSVPPMTVESATEVIHSRSGYSITPKAVGHTSQLASNMPIEDTWSSGAFTYFKDQTKDWYEWAIFDGHAGPRTAQLLKDNLPSIVGNALWEAKCMDRPHVSNDEDTVNTIKKAFQQIDHDIVDGAGQIVSGSGALAEVVSAGSAAFSGSCALLALFDPVRSILRVANVGDSRAVLGRWNGRRYVAMDMSVDQTGFDKGEVARLEREHPSEDVVDPKTGRVHGIAVSRAFGDARWKWPQALTRLAHNKFWGPIPRADGLIKTPPYLTAEPEITETQVRTGNHPDFLIMASDGLWDNMSSDTAVTCVQMWLEKNKPTGFLQEQHKRSSWHDFFSPPPAHLPTFSSASDLAGDDDTYYDEDERCLKWRVEPKHLIIEDEHAGVSLIKNALGGKRRELFCGVMSVQPPLSRAVRDDITVHVIFFGQDTPIQN